MNVLLLGRRKSGVTRQGVRQRAVPASCEPQAGLPVGIGSKTQAQCMSHRTSNRETSV